MNILLRSFPAKKTWLNLPMRAKILQLAASLDRMQRSDGDASLDDRYELLQKGLRILGESEEGRAERVQLLFSRPYDEEWNEAFDLSR